MQEYSYDKAGRLIQTNDWDAPSGGICTTRQYKFDGVTEAEKLAGENSNRNKMVTRSPRTPRAAATSGGTEQTYKYDAADRLVNEGTVYDDFGRITSLPANLAGGKTLSSSYFSTDMVASQAQNGVTNTFQLDASLRQRQRTQGGGLEGVEIFHSGGSSDSPAWIELGTKWSRNIGGIGGGVFAIQASSTETLLQLTNLHGDVVASATLSPSATEPVATFEHDEFGVPKLGRDPAVRLARFPRAPDGICERYSSDGGAELRAYAGPLPLAGPGFGGSANSYDYAGQDPVNALDLTGTVCQKKNKNSTKGELSRQARQRRKGRPERNQPPQGTPPERQRKATLQAHRWDVPIGVAFCYVGARRGGNDGDISGGQELLKELDKATSCDAGEAVALNGNAYYGYKAVNGATKVVRIAAARMAAKFSIIGAALATADFLGFC